MGRGCTMDEWAHFQKLPEEGRVPNSSYWYVLCRHCVAGYEQKQLFNAPTRLTGRRSAMRAHLKICPVYATQYKMEQEEAAARAEEEAAATDASTSATTGEKRKRESSGPRGGRGKHCMMEDMMEEWEHFTRLQGEGYIGNSNFFYAQCKHCQHAHDEAEEDQKPLLVPERLVGRREKMRKHLSICPHFKGALPPLERRLYRGNGMPPSVVFSALAAGAVAATTATANGSSRLALDEWNYFTRLERKKDSAYYFARCNFCQQAYENAPESLKSSMEPAIVTGRKSNMQTHLAKCLHVPKDEPTVMKITGHNAIIDVADTADAPLDGDVSSDPRSGRVEVTSVSPTQSPDNTSVHRALVKVLIEHHLPFKWVESDSAKQLFRALVPGSDPLSNLIPSTTDFRTHVLDGIHRATLLGELAKLQEPIPLEISASAFCADGVDTLSLVSVGPWPAMMHCNLSISHQLRDARLPAIEGVVANGKAIVSLSFVRAQHQEEGVEAVLAHNHGLEIARWINDHIRLCVDTAKLTLGAVVLPYNAMTQRAVGILRAPTHWHQVVFLYDIGDMLKFPLLKLLATAEMFTVVSSLIEVWQLESIRSCVMERLSEMDDGAHVSPFREWESCATLIQVLFDEKTFETSMNKGAATAKRLVENALNRSLLERVYSLLHAFTNAFSRCRSGVKLSEAMEHLSALFTAAEGFTMVQFALEVIWEQMEQPLFVLAHALNPQLRLRKINSTEITRLSTLSDLSVSYFTSFFGRKPNSLRGEVTAYLHTSQRVFTSEFVAEFPVLEDYFLYLRDNYPSLSMLMQVLHSLSSASLVTRSNSGPNKNTASNYTDDEHQKLEFIRGRWGIAPDDLSPKSQEELMSKIGAHNDRSGAAMLNASVVVDEWKENMEFKLHVRGVDFSLLDDKFDGVDNSDTPADQGKSEGGETTAHGLKLPSLDQDDELAYPSVRLRDEFSMKVPLKDLFKTAEATI
ncbi:hypothetical protein PHMEG_0005772 [Phytophthora megakarya]|uniref:BED-type domain-containing protein n=1 Tax=Phytophthora megakarya TaxID=4795 RepID=A0A225WQP6_9STRA|nr:hypothetical protein PHMEG_0005772 [Phytophthora megakarya]